MVPRCDPEISIYGMKMPEAKAEVIITYLGASIGPWKGLIIFLEIIMRTRKLLLNPSQNGYPDKVLTTIVYISAVRNIVKVTTMDDNALRTAQIEIKSIKAGEEIQSTGYHFHVQSSN